MPANTGQHRCAQHLRENGVRSCFISFVVVSTLHTCRKSITIRSMLNSCERVLFGVSESDSDVRKSIAKTVCFKDENIATIRLRLSILNYSSAIRRPNLRRVQVRLSKPEYDVSKQDSSRSATFQNDNFTRILRTRARV